MAEITKGMLPHDAEMLIDTLLKSYPEIIDPRGMSYEEYLWYQSRRAFLLEIKAKLSKQAEASSPVIALAKEGANNDET